MSHHVKSTLRCDEGTCPEEWLVKMGETVKEARQEAHAAGWRSVVKQRRLHDFCRTHNALAYS